MASTESSGSGDINRSLELLWGISERPTRGPKPGLTLDRIVTAAVELADAEGLEAVSMRRLSQELGTGTMSLYRYVPGKAELLDLMLDRVQAPAEDSDDAPGTGWRTALEKLARENLALHQRHPWLLQVNQARPVLGPGSLRGLEKALVPIKEMRLTDQELIAVIVMVDGYVTGVARSQIQSVEAARRSGLSDQEFWRAQEPILSGIMSSGEFPTLAGLDDDAFSFDFDHFEFGLRRLLDGLDVLVTQREAATGADANANAKTDTGTRTRTGPKAS